MRGGNAWIAVLACSALLAACSSSAADGGGTAAASLTGGVTADAIDPEVQRLTSMDPASLDSELRSTSAAAELELLALTGTDAPLGGPAAARAAYTSLTQSLVSGLAQQAGTPSFGRFGAAVTADDSGGIGGLTYGGIVVTTALAGGVIDSTNDLSSTSPGSGSKDISTDGVKGTLTQSATGPNDVSVDATATSGEGGIEGQVDSHVEAAPCPDANGQFTAQAAMKASAGTGGAGFEATISVEVTGHVDDDAQLVGFETNSTTQAGSQKGGDAITVTEANTYAGGRLTGNARGINAMATGTSEAFGRNWAAIGTGFSHQVAQRVVQSAQKAWESGRCVQIDVKTEPGKRSGLKPGAKVTITASPRSKVDGASAGGTVTAQLSGEASVDPAGTKVGADAQFTYAAPSEPGKTGTVLLEARSRRGVGRSEVAFDTNGAYTVSGNLGSTPETSFSGCMKTPDVPFSVTFGGGNVGSLSFAPSSAEAGKWTWQGKVSNAPMPEKGQGSYSVSLPDDGSAGSLTLKGTVVTNRLVDTYSQDIALTLTLTPSEC
jgi:hypothetical protein